jgi:hypothetical protein
MPGRMGEGWAAWMNQEATEEQLGRKGMAMWPRSGVISHHSLSLQAASVAHSLGQPEGEQPEIGSSLSCVDSVSSAEVHFSIQERTHCLAQSPR